MMAACIREVWDSEVLETVFGCISLGERGEKYRCQTESATKKEEATTGKRYDIETSRKVAITIRSAL